MHKAVFGAILPVLLSGAAMAQTAAPQPSDSPPAPPPVAPACGLPDMALSVDLTQVPGSDLVTVPVAINGKPKNFLLAVSSNTSSVSDKTVDDLKLIEGIKRTETFQTGEASQSDQTSMRDFRASGTVQISMTDARNAAGSDQRAHVNIPSFNMGGATGKNLTFAIATDAEIPKNAPYDGILTGSFFKQYDVELDFVAMKLNYLSPNKCSDPHQVVFWPHKDVAVIPMDMVNGKIQVQVSIGGHQISAILDTSSPRTIMRRDIAENTVGLKAGSPQMPPAGDMRDGEDMQIYTATFPQIAFAGGVTALNVPALIQVNGMTHNLHKEHELFSRAQFKNVQRIPALTLGMDVLRQLHLYIVYGQNNIYMTAAE